MRRAVNAEILRRDELREKQKMGELIQALNNKPQAHPQLYTLPSPVYGQITDPVLIQKELNDYFRAWLTLLENTDPAAERLARDPEWWASLAHTWSPEDDQLLHADSKFLLISTLVYANYANLRRRRKWMSKSSRRRTLKSLLLTSKKLFKASRTAPHQDRRA